LDYSPELEDRFRWRRSDFGMYASDMLDYLCNPLFNRPQADAPPYHDYDFEALSDLGLLENVATHLSEPLLAAYGHGLRLGDFEPRLRDFYHSLPFGEAERHWLLDLNYGAQSDDTEADLEAKLSRQEATIISTGLQRVVTGRSLLHRWLAWRREADEYSGQDTLSVARESLRELIEIVVPDTSMPESYAALQATDEQRAI
jgi:hypothetical protein